MTKTEQLESMIRGAGFVGNKFDAVWFVVLKLCGGGFSNVLILWCVVGGFSYLL